MPDTKHYTGLSIENKRYDKIRRDFDGVIQPGTDLTFTNWCVTAIEAAMERQKFLTRHFADLKVVSAEKGTIILFDIKLKKAVTVSISKDSIICSEKEGREKYVLYAILSPNMLP